VVWGTAYLVEAAARIVIVANTSTGTAFAVSKVMPYAVTAVLVAWNVAYGRHQKRRGEAMAAAAAAQPPRPASIPGTRNGAGRAEPPTVTFAGFGIGVTRS
jgi:hypothetical protein